MKMKPFYFIFFLFGAALMIQRPVLSFAAELSEEDKAAIQEIEENNRLQKKNEISIQKYLKKNPNSMTAQSDEYWDLAWHARLADAGDANSQYVIAKAYEEGKNVDENPQKAVSFYQMACDNQLPEACMRLGEIYSENKILLADVDKSLYWFTKAGKLNYTPAQFKVANLYADREDFKAACLWLEEALKHLFPDEKNLASHSPQLVVYQSLKQRQENAAAHGVKQSWRHEGEWLPLTAVQLQ